MAQPRRYELQKQLVTLLGSSNVYYQPPGNLTMQYPCIVYQLDKYEDKQADNLLYNHRKQYQVTVIDRDPDSVIPEKLNQIPYTSLNTAFVKDDLYHYIFTIYF